MMRVVLHAQLQEEVSKLGWRSEREYNMRQATAWGVQVGILFMAYFNSFIFCLGFGERETFKMVLSWIIAYGWTFAFIEPVQVCLLACCPCLWDEETRCGRCMNWVRFIYNELLSP